MPLTMCSQFLFRQFGILPLIFFQHYFVVFVIDSRVHETFPAMRTAMKGIAICAACARSERSPQRIFFIKIHISQYILQSVLISMGKTGLSSIAGEKNKLKPKYLSFAFWIKINLYFLFIFYVPFCCQQQIASDKMFLFILTEIILSINYMKTLLQIAIFTLLLFAAALSQVTQEQVDKKVQQINKRRQENLVLIYDLDTTRDDLKKCKDRLEHQEGCPVCPACPTCPVCPNVQNYISEVAELKEHIRQLEQVQFKSSIQSERIVEIMEQNEKLKDIIRKIRGFQESNDSE